MRRVPAERGGFVLVFVVLMLFAISVAAATGYLIVSSEFSMARNASDGAEALAVARAGLERFVAEQLGVVGDSVSYALGDGVALITTRKLYAEDATTDMYYIRSEGTVTDIRTPATPARRVVGSYALHHRSPLRHFGAIVTSASTVIAQSGGYVSGHDNRAFECSAGAGTSITGAISEFQILMDSLSTIEGSPGGEVWSGGYTQVLDSIGLRWDVLSDPDFPVDFDGVWPNFAMLPSDSFPVVRMTGWVSAAPVGRGVLIIDGMFDADAAFHWDGIVLAKDIDDIIEGQVHGLVVGGLEANNFYPTVYWRGQALYHSCFAADANESLSYLELIDNTVFETY